VNIFIKTIPFANMRYPSVGDYFIDHMDDGTEVLVVCIARLGNWRYEACVTIHELVEIFIVKHQGIPFEKIDRFDEAFERRRKKGNTDEPGDDPRAPYKFAHCIASGVERVVAAVLGVSWKKYEAVCDKLMEGK